MLESESAHSKRGSATQKSHCLPGTVQRHTRVLLSTVKLYIRSTCVYTDCTPHFFHKQPEALGYTSVNNHSDKHRRTQGRVSEVWRATLSCQPNKIRMFTCTFSDKLVIQHVFLLFTVYKSWLRTCLLVRETSHVGKPHRVMSNANQRNEDLWRMQNPEILLQNPYYISHLRHQHADKRSIMSTKPQTGSFSLPG